METINYYPSTTTIGGLLFSNYISEEIRCLSVKELTSSQAIDRLGVLISDSPYDLALGPFDKKNDRCFTCDQGICCLFRASWTYITCFTCLQCRILQCC
ncbi:unnamed protein product [Rotaria sp. Silwood1]|nr:unnamed protein product [Rotaria sp. Silwood1]CAF5009878.1 unnamed protein product [Rotaria sp. Silwood1]